MEMLLVQKMKTVVRSGDNKLGWILEFKSVRPFNYYYSKEEFDPEFICNVFCEPSGITGPKCLISVVFAPKDKEFYQRTLSSDVDEDSKAKWEARVEFGIGVKNTGSVIR